MTVPASDNRNGAQTLRRALAVLDFLRDHPGSHRLSDIAAATGLSPTVAHRLLSELKAHSLVDQGAATREYRLGNGVLSYASAVLRDSDIVRVGAPIVRRLRDECAETTTLQVPSGRDRVVVYEAEARHELRHRAPVGQKVPMHASASGRAMLAFMSADEIEDVLAGPFQSFTDQTVTSAESIRGELEEIRRRGFAVVHDQTRLGIGAVAAPVFRLGGRPIGSIAVTGPSERILAVTETLTAAVLHASAEISTELGFSPAAAAVID
ncbi:MAG: hypothetical protein BGO95_00600 [Micrococcales bacterium 73-13]|nr:MAG: hypothetical protein BGO95_00600 [Micrococcales bacterium 73-13]